MSGPTISTTHTGSLPRPAALAEILTERDHGLDTAVTETDAAEQIRAAVAAVVERQTEAGLDVISDGEMSKFGYSTYVKERLSGFDGEAAGLTLADLADFPEHAKTVVLDITTPACTGPVAYADTTAVETDVANLTMATAGKDVADCFISAASPGVIATFLANRYYARTEDYLFALADAMKTEYDAIHRAGFQVQVDCPDLAMGRHLSLPPMDVDSFRRQAELHIEVLNHAVRDIPPERLRMHLCWGNYASPHHYDVPLAHIIDLVLRARPCTVLFEAANPRHEHEWRVFEDLPLPDGKIIVPGVVDTLTSYVEHPELVAERITRYADLVGEARVMAGADCGFATFANFLNVDPAIAWAKLESLSRGARLASQRRHTMTTN